MHQLSRWARIRAEVTPGGEVVLPAGYLDDLTGSPALAVSLANGRWAIIPTARIVTPT